MIDIIYTLQQSETKLCIYTLSLVLIFYLLTRLET